MANAFECDRCKKVITRMDRRYTFTPAGELCKIIYPPDKRDTVDLCLSCLDDLKIVVDRWWNGLAP